MVKKTQQQQQRQKTDMNHKMQIVRVGCHQTKAKAIRATQNKDEYLDE